MVLSGPLEPLGGLRWPRAHGWQVALAAGWEPRGAVVGILTLPHVGLPACLPAPDPSMQSCFKGTSSAVPELGGPPSAPPRW